MDQYTKELHSSSHRWSHMHVVSGRRIPRFPCLRERERAVSVIARHQCSWYRIHYIPTEKPIICQKRSLNSVERKLQTVGRIALSFRFLSLKASSPKILQRRIHLLFTTVRSLDTWAKELFFACLKFRQCLCTMSYPGFAICDLFM